MQDIDLYSIKKACGAKFLAMVKPVASFPGGLTGVPSCVPLIYSAVTFFPRLILRYKFIVLVVLVLFPKTWPSSLRLVETASSLGYRGAMTLAYLGPFRPYSDGVTED